VAADYLKKEKVRLATSIFWKILSKTHRHARTAQENRLHTLINFHGACHSGLGTFLVSPSRVSELPGIDGLEIPAFDRTSALTSLELFAASSSFLPDSIAKGAETELILDSPSAPFNPLFVAAAGK
jgi:hypothetical protein